MNRNIIYQVQRSNDAAEFETWLLQRQSLCLKVLYKTARGLALYILPPRTIASNWMTMKYEGLMEYLCLASKTKLEKAILATEFDEVHGKILMNLTVVHQRSC